MNSSSVNIVDLCDEMLLAILNKLNHIDVLYSLMEVNQKFDRLIQDLIFTQSLDFTVLSANEDNRSRINSILDRFSSYIIPRIQNNIQCLTVDQCSIDSLLCTGKYTKLQKLALPDITLQMAIRIFYDPSSFIYKLNHQIFNLSITINGNNGRESHWVSGVCIFAKIPKIFTRLTHFQFDLKNKFRYKPMLLTPIDPKAICCSSNIVHLNIKVNTFNDCLWTLNGQFSQLHTLIVYIEYIRDTRTITKTPEILTKFKTMSLSSYNFTFEYDDQIVPFIRQMSQLERLTLSLCVHQRTSFVDGAHLVNDIISQMPCLQTFVMDIVTEHVPIDRKDFPTSDNVGCQLISRGYPVDCYIENLWDGTGRCHLYSVPFTMRWMQTITNQFLSHGIFRCVRKICVNDAMRSIEHDFFNRISQTFPLLEELTVLSKVNQRKKTNKQNEFERTFPVVVYSHLLMLDLVMSHVDYAKQFLLDTNTRLPRLDTLRIDYENLVNVTDNFTSATARANCVNLKNIIFPVGQGVLGKSFYSYFPFVDTYIIE